MFGPVSDFIFDNDILLERAIFGPKSLIIHMTTTQTILE